MTALPILEAAEKKSISASFWKSENRLFFFIALGQQLLSQKPLTHLKQIISAWPDWN